MANKKLGLINIFQLCLALVILIQLLVLISNILNDSSYLAWMTLLHVICIMLTVIPVFLNKQLQQKPIKIYVRIIFKIIKFLCTGLLLLYIWVAIVFNTSILLYYHLAYLSIITFLLNLILSVVDIYFYIINIIKNKKTKELN